MKKNEKKNAYNQTSLYTKKKNSIKIKTINSTNAITQHTPLASADTGSHSNHVVWAQASAEASIADHVRHVRVHHVHALGVGADVGVDAEGADVAAGVDSDAAGVAVAVAVDADSDVVAGVVAAAGVVAGAAAGDVDSDGKDVVVDSDAVDAHAGNAADEDAEESNYA